MTERPVIFSGPMVRAILEGRKTQTRRVFSPRHPISLIGGRDERDDPSAWGYFFDGPDHNGYMVLGRGHDERENHGKISIPSQYGEAGDRLWVRETHAQFAVGNKTGLSPQCVAYRATCGDDGGFEYVNNGDEIMRLRVTKWTPAIYMPRWASRIALEVDGVRVQRLMDISDDDARAEGVEPYTPPHGHISPEQCVPGPGFERCRLGDQPHRLPFADLWDSINGKRAPWQSNPWVWAITFKRIEGTT